MLKFFTAFPYTREEIADAGTSISPNKIVKSMNANLSNMLERDIARFGFDMKQKRMSKEASGPGMGNAPHSS